jgi:hypothetical protein
MAGNTLSRMFGKSPITPMQEHIETAHSAAILLNPFFQAVLKEDWTEAKAVQKQISKLERDADKMKKNVRLNLPKSLFLPVSRTDLLDLVTMQDKIANSSKDIAGLMLGRKMQIPEAMSEQMVEYVDGAIATSAQAVKAIQELEELLETGFKGREVAIVQELIEELDRLESSNDKVQVKVRAKLFTLEKNLPPVDVMFLYKVIDRIGQLADRAQRVGSRLQLLIAR